MEMRAARSTACAATVLTFVTALAGCQAMGKPRPNPRIPAVRRVVCLYDATPWLNLDRAGDLNPEGFRFRVFLDTGNGRGSKVAGTLHVEMYRLERDPKTDRMTRKLVSDWHYPTADLPQIVHPGMLGDGYFPQLVWADKDLAGSEVDVVVSFEDENGNMVRAATKRLKIPRYED